METHFQSQVYFPTTDASSHTPLPVNHLKPTKKTPFFSWLSFRKHRQADDKRSHRVKIFRGFKLAHTSDSGYNVPFQFPKQVSIIWFGRCVNLLNLLCEFPETCLFIFVQSSLLSPAKYKYEEHLLVPTPADKHSGLECPPEPCCWWTFSPFLQFHQQAQRWAPLWRAEELNRWKMHFISDNSCRKIRWKPKHPSTLKKHLSLNWQRGKMRLDVCVSADIPAP